MHQVEIATTREALLDAPEMTLNMGPQHPSTHGVLRVVLKLDGETVIDLDCDVGYLHRGMEKIAENRMYTMIAPYWDRLDYIAAVSNGLVWVETVEQMLGLDVPRRAHYIRTILTELNRIASHLLWLLTGVVLLALSLWRGGLNTIAGWFGVETYPPAILGAIGALFILVVLLHYSTVISRLSDQNTILAQRLALLEQQVREG